MCASSNETIEHSRRVLCLGGSFNPIHYGHIRCARAAAISRNFGSVILILSSQPPHKPLASDLAAPQDRLEMSKLAAQYCSDPQVRFEVDDLELRRNGPSYTIDTARELRRRGYTEVNW